MSRGYRGIILAAVGFIALYGFCLGYYHAALNYPQEQRYEPYRAAADKIDDVDATAAKPPEFEPFEYRAPCEKPKGKDESDLCAQWKAARAAEAGALWTERAFWLGIVGVMTTGVGTALLLRTIKQGEEALNVARASTKMEQRAWVRFDLEAIDGPYLDEDERWRFGFTATVVNIGNSPAREFRYWPVLCLDNPEQIMEIELKRMRDCPPEWSGAIIFPGEEHPLSFTINLEPALAEPIIEAPDGKKNFEVFIVFIAEYRTSFDDVRHFTARIYRIIDKTRFSTDISFSRPDYRKDVLMLRRYGEGPGFAD